MKMIPVWTRTWTLTWTRTWTWTFFSAAVPSAPQAVISSVNETSVMLEWMSPRDSGGREDVVYNIICKSCGGGRGGCTRCGDNVQFLPRQLGLTESRVYISDLLAHTQYTFEVQAVNGVSDQSPYSPQYASVNITTNQAGKWTHLSLPSSVAELKRFHEAPVCFLSFAVRGRMQIEGHKMESRALLMMWQNVMACWSLRCDLIIMLPRLRSWELYSSCLPTLFSAHRWLLSVYCRGRNSHSCTATPSNLETWKLRFLCSCFCISGWYFYSIIS